MFYEMRFTFTCGRGIDLHTGKKKEEYMKKV